MDRNWDWKFGGHVMYGMGWDGMTGTVVGISVSWRWMEGRSDGWDIYC